MPQAVSTVGTADPRNLLELSTMGYRGAVLEGVPEVAKLVWEPASNTVQTGVQEVRVRAGVSDTRASGHDRYR